MTISEVAAEERVLRILHPEDFDNGKINSTAFNPSEEHDFLLSIDRSTMTSAEECFRRHTESGRRSIGVCGVAVSDFRLEAISVFSDPLEGNSAHALADYRPHGSSQRRKKARRIAEIAARHGLDYIAS